MRFFTNLILYYFQFTLFFCLVLSNIALAQTAKKPLLNCASGQHFTAKQVADLKRMDAKLLVAANNRSLARTNDRATLTVPVVFHAFENQDGDGHLNDSLILAGLAELNLAFSDTLDYAHPLGYNTHIRFCLAKRTPTGDSTSGITRHVSRFAYFDTGADEDSLQGRTYWDPDQYLNIWTTKDIVQFGSKSPILGISTFPISRGEPTDGVVVVSSIFETRKGISVLAHEIGHYLGLYHTFQAGCYNEDCRIDGDHVCDTPPCRFDTAITNTCQTDLGIGSPFATDLDDYRFDFMHYSHFDDYKAFTPEQAFRMRSSLTGYRQSLLDAQSCSPPCATPLVNAVQIAATTITAGSALAANVADIGQQVEWRVNGDVIGTTFSINPVFANQGDYLLECVQKMDNCALKNDFTITVVCPSAPSFSYTLSGNNLQVQTATSLPNIRFSIAESGSIDSVFSTQTTGNVLLGANKVYTVCLHTEQASCASNSCQTVNADNLRGRYPAKVLNFSNSEPLSMNTGIYHLGENKLFWGGTGGDKAILLKVDSCSDILWTSSYWSGGNATILNSELASDNQLIISGSQNSTNYAIAKVSPTDGAATWIKTTTKSVPITFREMRRMQKTGQETGKYLVLYQENTPQGGFGIDVWNENGDLTAQYQYQSATENWSAFAATQVGSGGFAVVGTTAENKPFLIRTDATGNLIFSKKIPIANQSIGKFTDIVTFAGDELAVAGTLRDSSIYDNNTLCYFDGQGNLKWSKQVATVRLSTLGGRLNKLINGDLQWLMMQDKMDYFNTFNGMRVMTFSPDFVVKNTERIEFRFLGNSHFAHRAPNIRTTHLDNEQLILAYNTIQIVGDSTFSFGFGLISGNTPATSACNMDFFDPTTIDTDIRIHDTPFHLYEDHPLTILNNLSTASNGGSANILGGLQQSDACCGANLLLASLCRADSVSLTADADYTGYHWSTGDSTRTITVNHAGIFSCVLTKPCKRCLQFALVTKEISQDSVHLGPDVIVCGRDTMLTARGGQYFNYEWYNGKRDSTITLDTAGVFWVRVMDLCGNVFSDTIKVSFGRPKQLFPMRDTIICPNTPITLTLPLTNLSHFGWESPNGTLVCDTCATATFTAHDSTQLIVTAVTSAHCWATDTLKIKTFPEPSLDAGRDTIVLYGQQVFLLAKCRNIDSTTLRWQPFTQLSCETCIAPIFTGVSSQDYVLTGSSEHGCQARDSLRIVVVDECPIAIPNVFSPDGNGINDFFTISTPPCIKTVHSCQIFDNLGELVFSKYAFKPEDEPQLWNGEFHGKIMNTNVFVYTIDIETIDGKRFRLIGDLTLLGKTK